MLCSLVFGIAARAAARRRSVLIVPSSLPQGRQPWSAELATCANQFAIMFHIASCGEPPPMPEDLHADAARLLNWCFDRDPAERPTAVELLAHVRGSELMAAWLAHARAEPPAGGVKWVSPPLLSEAEFDSSAG